MPWALLDGSESDEVKQRPDSGIDPVIQFPPFLVCKSGRLDKLWRAIEVLLKKHRRFNATRISLQNRRPVLQIRHDVIGNFQIVTEEIKLRELLVGPIDAVQTRH